MKTTLSRTILCTLVPATLLVLGACSRATTIKSDLVLDAQSRARIQLHQPTQAIELLNDSDADVRVVVLDKKDRVVSNMLLSARDRARLDLLPARALEFDNPSDKRAVVHWVLRNNDRIEYSLAMNPTN
ncbi:MAG: hypothetical protein ACYSTY_01705 [Planctomycetota bacterium]|jgi:hypothetical protein